MKLTLNIMLLAATVSLSTGFIKSHLRRVLGSAIANGADAQVKYDGQACIYFQMWETSDKEIGCTCKKL